MKKEFCEEMLKDRIDWESFLKRHDLVYETLPVFWKDGAFIGNGLIGAVIYKERLKHNKIRWDIGRSDVTERRDNEDTLSGKGRLPIGKMVLTTVGNIKGGSMRVDLWNAEVRGMIETDKGEVEFRSFVHTEKKVIVIEIKTSRDEDGCRFLWYPDIAVSPRKYQLGEVFVGGMNPVPVERKIGEVNVCTQALLAGGEYAVAWQETWDSDRSRIVYLSVGSSYPEPGGEKEAVESVSDALNTGLEALEKSHREWWHRYYAASFLSVPDTRLESFYWIQMYKLASATRADRPAIDLMGPWFYKETPWPGIWWNLNIQLTYWPVYASNHLELGESLCRMLDNNIENLILNVPEQYREDSAAIGRVSSYDCRSNVGKELCNLPWVCHNYWLQYRYSMDDDMLRNRLFPLLRRSINYYLHILEESDDGKLHLPVAISPEYPREAPDCNIDLALLRWGCQTLISICKRLGIEDPLMQRWQEVLEKLADYPVDENGFMIGRGVPFSMSHRHYSHLLAIYPLYIVNWEQAENRELILRSLKHWMSMKELLRGYSYTGAASISASIGNGEDAASYLNEFLDQRAFPVTRNTMYLEAGPVIETPLSAARSLQEMLLQSWGGKIRIFPAVPYSWKDVAFHNLLAEGAFLVSAVRKEGKTRFVRIKSLAGEPCRIQALIQKPLRILAGRDIAVKELEDGVIEVDLLKGEEVLICSADIGGGFEIQPVKAQEDRCNFFGIRGG